MEHPKVAVMCKRSVKGAVHKNFSKRIVKSILSGIIDEIEVRGYLGFVIQHSLKQYSPDIVSNQIHKSLTEIISEK